METPHTSTVIIVHGEKPLRDCSMHPAFKERLDEAIRVCATRDICAMYITGGETRKGCVTEAQAGMTYLKQKVSCPVFMEAQARSTSENVRFCKKIISHHPTHMQCAVLAITSRRRVHRVLYLYRRLWKNIGNRLEVIGAKDFYSRFYPLLECIYFLYDIVDPKERTLARMTKKIFRNAYLFSFHDRHF